jgi:hypothetical protein
MNVVEQIKPGSDSSEQIGALGYSKLKATSTLGILKKIENHERDGNAIRHEPNVRHNDSSGQREKYKSYIRQLPARTFVEKLVETYFQEVNWHYSILDKPVFLELLNDWNSLSFASLSKGPQELPRDLRFFPALLFQVLALAIQFLPPVSYDPSFESLKYVQEMSFDDLATDYSESGSSLLALLGKRDATLVTVHAGFLRTSFLKNSGLVTESWHSLGQTIRDAQEIGLHKDVLDHIPNSPGKAIEALWQLEHRRRTWCGLCLWDCHMGLVLGRPTSIDARDACTTLPIDTPLSIDRKNTMPFPRPADDPPTPLTAFILSYKSIATFREILALEQEGPHPRDYTKVEKVHKEIILFSETIPAYIRTDNPDTTFDSHPECSWLPATRHLLNSSIGFSMMSLHRPYVFTIAKSRSEALRGALRILRAQREFFMYLESRHYKMFNLVLSTFDAIVLVAAVYILHPTENAEQLSLALQHIEWGMERFQTMSDRNQMAKAALGVLQAIDIRLQTALGRRGVKRSTSALETPRIKYLPSASNTNSPENGKGCKDTGLSQRSSPSGHESANSGNPLNADINSSSSYSDYVETPDMGHISDNGVVDTNSYATAVLPSAAADDSWPPFTMCPWNYTPNFNLGDLAPLQPMHDLLFNDLVGTMETTAPIIAPDTNVIYDPNTPWQFEGEFRDDSFWNFMNMYNP